MPFFLTLFLFLNVWGVELQIPTLRSPVMDEAGFLSSSEKQDLENLAYEIHTHQGPQITILTVNDLQGYPIEEFSIRVAEKWKLGLKEKGNGLLITVSKAERKVRIEVGEGIEGDITDYESSMYIRNILTPAFKQGQFHAGLRLVMEDVARKFGINLEGQGQRIVHRSQRPVEMAFPLLLPIMIALLFITQISFRNHSMLRAITGGAGVAGAGLAILGLGSIFFIVILFFVGFVFGIIGFHNVLFALAQGGGHGGRYRGGGGGFGGGGGWSGGGGGFSGGGSSGDW